MAKVNNSEDAKNQAGFHQASKTVPCSETRAPFPNAVEAKPRFAEAARVSGFRATSERRRSGRRWRESRERLLMSRVVLAATTLGVLLSSLVAVRFIVCFEALTLHGLTPQRMFSGGTSRRLAGVFGVAEFVHIAPGGGESTSRGMEDAPARCPEGSDEILRMLLPSTQTGDSHSADDSLPRDQQVPWRISSPLDVAVYVSPLLFLGLAVASGLTKAVVPNIAQSTDDALTYATCVFIGLAVAAAVVVLTVDIGRLQLTVRAGEKALLVLLSLSFVVAVTCALIAISRSLAGQSTGTPLMYAIYASAGLIGVAAAAVIGIRIWRIVASYRSGPERVLAPPSASENGHSRGEAQPPHQQARGLKESARVKAFFVLPFLLFAAATACWLTSIVRGKSEGPSLRYATYGLTGLAALTAVAVLGVQTWRFRLSHRRRSRGVVVSSTASEDDHPHEDAQPPHQQASQLKSSAVEKALFVSPFLFFVVAAACALTAFIVRHTRGNAGSSVAYATYGFTGVAAVAAVSVLASQIKRLRSSRRSRSGGVVTSLTASPDDHPRGGAPPSHQEVPGLKMSVGDKALFVLPSLLFVVAVACWLTTLLRGRGQGPSLAYVTYGFTGLATVAAVAVLAIQIRKLQVSGRSRSRRAVVPLTASDEDHPRGEAQPPHEQAPRLAMSTGEKALFVLPFLLFVVALVCGLTKVIVRHTGPSTGLGLTYVTYGFTGLAGVAAVVVLAAAVWRLQMSRRGKSEGAARA
ncbi:hypothetical protein CSUI_009776 [Cystoisospora suis]|uniref:Transmembrane protein n=1 Tax=Cystoisospora suis TaxID=483139 RepID=A0A2C6K1M3_9APIC|nr:hypothetical protein CSUI_009776 [Cystoisospora suis]